MKLTQVMENQKVGVRKVKKLTHIIAEQSNRINKLKDVKAEERGKRWIQRKKKISKNNLNKEVKILLNVEKIDEAIGKAKELVEILREANELIKSL